MNTTSVLVHKGGLLGSRNGCQLRAIMSELGSAEVETKKYSIENNYCFSIFKQCLWTLTLYDLTRTVSGELNYVILKQDC